MFAALMSRAVSAQTFQNGSFETGDFTGWQVTVNPMAVNPTSPAVLGSPPTPVNGNFQALINSTGNSLSGIYANANSVSAATLNTFLNTTLPSNAGGNPVNGEAIQQTFSTATGATVSFSYKYESREAPGDGFDEAGYVLNGVFYSLADTSTPGETMANADTPFVWGLPYQTVSITVGPGVNTLSFVVYNTGNTSAPTGLFVDNVTVTPVPAITYATVDPSGTTGTQANAVSGNNVVGFYTDGGGVQHGFFFDGTNYTTLDPTGTTGTQATGVSGANVVGLYQSGGMQHGFFFDGTNYTTVDPPGSIGTQPTGVSGNNVVGWYQDSNLVLHGFFFDGTNYTTVDPTGTTRTEITGVDGTTMAGFFVSGDGAFHGFIFDGTTYTTLDDPQAVLYTSATGISGSNVVGFYVDGNNVQHGFLYNGGTYTTLDPPGSTGTIVTGVSGTNIVGYYSDSQGVQHGFFYNGGTYTTVDPAGTTSTEVLGVSGDNAVGYYADSNGVHHGFLSGVGKTAAAVTLSNSVVTYNAAPQSATATTVPANLSLTYTYNGSATPPTLPGTYAVVATVKIGRAHV